MGRGHGQLELHSGRQLDTPTSEIYPAPAPHPTPAGPAGVGASVQQLLGVTGGGLRARRDFDFFPLHSDLLLVEGAAF